MEKTVLPLLTLVSGQTTTGFGTGCDVTVCICKKMLAELTKRVNYLEKQRKTDMIDSSGDLEKVQNYLLRTKFRNATRSSQASNHNQEPLIQGKVINQPSLRVHTNSTTNHVSHTRGQLLNGLISGPANRVGTVSPPSDTAAFYARLGHNLSDVAREQVIHFETIVTNVGGHYSPNTGVFTCGSPGTFVFAWSVYTEHPTWIDSELVKNGNAFSFSRAGQSAYNEETSSTAVVDLSSWDMVWLRIRDRSSSAKILADYTTLSGFKI
ncbi:complement C1q-like protein 4 [Argopecten irradians]|uniref:complement C1q-like protein 4 n=1 Tax=Argopecten irradians TaxID=31199 RepID=UPI00371EB29D